MTSVLAIDPGAKGGIALLAGDALRTWPMPKDFTDSFRLILKLTEEATHTVVEQLSPGPAFGKVKTNKRGIPILDADGEMQAEKLGQVASFKMGCNFAHVRAALVAGELINGVPWRSVRAQVWESIYPGVGGAKGYGDRKRRLCEVAKKMFPNAHIVHSTADAALIAVWMKGQLAMERKAGVTYRRP